MMHINDDLLNEYLDEQLDAATHERVNTHLAACEACREQVVERQQLFTALEQMGEVPLMVDLSRQVVARLSAEFQPRPMPRWTFPIIGLQLLAALALFIWLWPAFQTLLETAVLTLPQAAGQFLPDFSLSDAVDPLLNGLESLSELGEAVGPNSPLPVLEGFLIIGLVLILWLAGSGLLLRQSLAVQNKS